MVHNWQWKWVWIPCDIIRCFHVWFGWFVGGFFVCLGLCLFVCEGFVWFLVVFCLFLEFYLGWALGFLFVFYNSVFLIFCSLAFPAPPIPLEKLALSKQLMTREKRLPFTVGTLYASELVSTIQVASAVHLCWLPENKVLSRECVLSWTIYQVSPNKVFHVHT